MSVRVIDAGVVTAVRSQALWHGLAEAMRPGEEPVLSLCTPGEPYVCLGYHRRMDEIDPHACAAQGVPVLRRQIGGGPVFLDSDQLFFGLTIPAAGAPAQVDRLYARLLEPACAALRGLGVEARIVGTNDIVAGGRKISGTGAGRIGEGVVVVGNVMFAFAHERMAEILRVPDESMRAECLALMREHLGTLPELRPDAVKTALIDAYAAEFGEARSGALRARERSAIAGWERRMRDPDWVAGPTLGPRPGRQVKIRAGVWVYDHRADDVHVRVRVEDGRVRRASVAAHSFNGGAAKIAEALVGANARVQELAERLQDFGDDGARVLDALAPGLVVR
ncbi:MAG TPA: hypothetical protein VFN65_00190 [Solirubrobacteraceae bacterium]|nr:hypothetical protein [Solirubrobacteraceae bacterium]